MARLACVGLAVAALSACGSAHRVRLADYSVRQVKRVFAAHGIPLRQTRYGPTAGVVELVDHDVEVDVAVGHGTEKWLSGGLGDFESRASRNVIVTYPHSQVLAVRAALRSLRA